MTREAASHSRFYAVRRRLEQVAVAPGWRGALLEFAIFVCKQGGRACSER